MKKQTKENNINTIHNYQFQLTMTIGMFKSSD